ncbi:Molybdopterin synthase sulfur carrier subunit [Galemys pyrenaicus]|uniref:Molybdopterin synthase sulfur carrier subunit n=1 Tax=Galemys pyrenaicus TaxID=202257 RepID=A0A8J6AMH3_GALPY|nr:Molybdopterin synthase sulfur carrier subunit [Galemys pyrenaicus]
MRSKIRGPGASAPGGDSPPGIPGGMVPLCQVEVLYFAKSAEITGIRSETISVPQEIKALQLWNEIESRHPGLADVKKSGDICCSSRICRTWRSTPLAWIRRDEIAIIPPISGG